MEERRITEIFIAARQCDAKRDGEGWSHKSCDHTQPLLQQRAQVKKLPPVVVQRLVDTLDAMTASQREAGNSDAPASSSESSEPSSASEAPLTPSSQEEMPAAVPTS